MLIVINLIVDAIAFVVSAFCGMKLWNWFVPEVFESAPQLGFWSAMGIGFLSSCFISTGKSYKFSEFIDADAGELSLNGMFSQLIEGIMKPIILLIYGWFVFKMFVN